MDVFFDFDARALAHRALEQSGPSFDTPQLPASKRIAFIGSSSEFGIGSGTGSAMTIGARQNCYFYQAGLYLRSLGLPVNLSGRVGDGSEGSTASASNGAAYSAFDERITFSGTSTGWSVHTDVSFGGRNWRAWPSAGLYNLDFAFDEDSTEISFLVGATSATARSFQYGVDGGTLATFASSAAQMNRITIPGLVKGKHTLNLRFPSTAGPSFLVSGFECRDTSRNEIRFLFAGAGGWNTTTTYWTNTTTPFNAMAMLPIVAPNVLVECFGGNEDFTGANSVTDFITRCGTFHAACKAAGIQTAAIIKPFRFAGGVPPGDHASASEYAIRDARIAFAKTLGIPYYDLSAPAGARSLASANGEMNADNLHYKAAWHARVGRGVGQWLFSSGLLF